MTSTDEYPHEFILGIPFFREYMVTFEMPLRDNGDSHSRSDFRDRRVYLSKHDGGCEFPDRPVDEAMSLKRQESESSTTARQHVPKLSSLVFPRTFRKLDPDYQNDHHENHHNQQHQHQHTMEHHLAAHHEAAEPHTVRRHKPQIVL